MTARDKAAGKAGQGAPNWRELFVEPSKQAAVIELTPAQEIPVAARRIELNSDYYVSVILQAYHFPFRRRLTTVYTPIIAFETSWKMPTSEDEAILSIAGPASSPLAGSARGGAFVSGGQTMFGPVCLNGAFKLRAGLYVSKWNDKTRSAIDLVKLGADMATDTDVLVLKPVSNFAFAMLKKLFPDQPSACYAGIDVELPEAGGAELSTGTWAVLPEEQQKSFTTRDLRFDPADRRLKTLDGKALKCPYFVYSIIAHERHPERLNLPEIREARMRLKHAVKENPSIPAEELADLHKGLKLSIKLCDRLNRKDRAELSAEADEMYTDILSIISGTDTAAQNGVGEAVAARVETEKTATAAFSDERAGLEMQEIADTAFEAAKEAVADSAQPDLPAGKMEEAAETLQAALADLAQLVIEDEEAWADKAIDMAIHLRKQRQFAALADFAMHIRDGGVHNDWLYYFGAAAAVELGDLEQAEAYLVALLPRAEQALDETPDNRSRALLLSDTLGLRGRIWKSRAAGLEEGDPGAYHAYHQALKYYGQAEAMTISNPMYNMGDTEFHRVNILALVKSAEDKKIKEFSRRRKPYKVCKGWAQDIITRIEQSNELPSKFDLANAGDACLFLKDEARAVEYYRRYIEAERENPFQMNNCRRQLLELWGVRPGDEGALPAIVREMGALAAAGPQSFSFTLAEAEAILKAADDGELQASFDGVSGTLIEDVIDVIELSKSVGMVKRMDGSEVGSGFLLHGRHIHPSLANEYVFLTNDHVVSDHRSYAGTVSSQEALIFFERINRNKGHQVREVFWRSPVEKHDCAILRLTDPPTDIDRPIEISPILPRRWLRDGGYDPEMAEKTASRVYVIGHPLGGAMRITLEKHFFIDHDGPEDSRAPAPLPVNVHYRAPTEKGNSGSPVFDAATRSLIAIHHKASRTPLHRKRGRGSAPYQANQGKWIRAIIAAVQADIPLAGSGSGSGSGPGPEPSTGSPSGSGAAETPQTDDVRSPAAVASN